MWPILTRRRVAGVCLLTLAVLFLGFGMWHESLRLSVLGLATLMVALLGFGYLLIQRINTLMQLSDAACSGLEDLEVGQRKSIWLQRKSVKQLSDQSTRLNAIRKAYETGLKQQAKELDRLISDAGRWSDEYYGQLCAFRSQFGEFVASVAEWVALAEAGAKQSVEELQDGRASAIEEVVNQIMQRMDGVDHVLANVHDASEQIPRAVAANSEQIQSISKALEAAEMRDSARGELFEGLLKQIDGVDCKLSTLQEVAAKETGTELIDAVSRAEARTPEYAGMLDNLQQRLDVLNDTVLAVQQTSSQMNGIVAADSEQIRGISKVVTAILPSQRTEIARAKVESVREVEAILQLQAYLAPEKPMPLLGDWAMDPVSMLRVVNELVRRAPDLVLECGSGTSTLWIARTLKRLGKGRVVSLEHLEEHHAATSRALHAAELDNYVDVCLAPLRRHYIGTEEFKWYDLRCLELRECSVDLLLIDGPPKATGPLARYPALPLLERMLADHALIILDDANRPEEIEGATRWLKEYPGLQEFGELGERTKMFIYSTPSPQKRRGFAKLQALSSPIDGLRVRNER